MRSSCAVARSSISRAIACESSSPSSFATSAATPDFSALGTTSCSAWSRSPTRAPSSLYMTVTVAPSCAGRSTALISSILRHLLERVTTVGRLNSRTVDSSMGAVEVGPLP